MHHSPAEPACIRVAAVFGQRHAPCSRRSPLLAKMRAFDNNARFNFLGVAFAACVCVFALSVGAVLVLVKTNKACSRTATSCITAVCGLFLVSLLLISSRVNS
jgi:hypothetical protein